MTIETDFNEGETMKLNIRILRTNNEIEHKTVNAPRYRNFSNAIIYIGTEMRRNDPSICAIRIDGVERYTWMGHYTEEHMRVIVAREHNGTDNW